MKWLLDKSKTKVWASLLTIAALGLGAAAGGTPAMAEEADVSQGVTVSADTNSPTGYTATFVYNNPDATLVRLAGDLTLRGLDSGTTRFQPEEWEQGRYHAGGTEFLRDMTVDDQGNWSVTVPLHAGGLSYWYRVWDPTQGWENKRIWDPASTNPRPEGDNSFRVRNNDVLDVVYVPYADKQSDPVLESRARYELPAADPAQRGTVQYVPYTTVLGDEGHQLGIYLPAGHDPDRAEPYKVVYLAHGIFGDETDFLIPVNVPNILDNMTARGEIEPTVVVTMGNHFTGDSLGFASYNQTNAAQNLVEVILPLVEDEYNVATDRAGRAYGGFSYGGMTSGHVLRGYPTEFGYFGLFSGNPSLSAAEYDQAAAAIGDQDLFVFLGNGIFEGSLNAADAVADNFRSRGYRAETTQVPGAHDGMTASQLFTIFAKNHLWKEAPQGVLNVRNVTDVGSYGQQVVATVLEYSDDVSADSLSTDAFTARDNDYNFRFDPASSVNVMADREIARVYTTSDPDLLLEEERPESAGRFVVLEYEPDLDLGWTTITVPGNPRAVMVNPAQPTEVTQLADVHSTDGALLSEGDPELVLTPTQAPLNRQVDDFAHDVFEGSVGAPLNYHYRLPDDYDPSKKYPLVVALPGHGQGYDGANNLGVHLTTDMLALAWANPDWTDGAEDVIVLAPQNVRSSAPVEGQQTVELIEHFSQEFAVDTRRVYATSVSYGSTLMWWMFANRPELFAGGLLTGGFQNNVAQANAIAAAEVPIWITHGTNDHLLPVRNALASYQRIVDAYLARGFSQAAIDELVRWTEYGNDAFTLPDYHLASAPTLEDPSTISWLLGKEQPLQVSASIGTRCVAGKVMPTITVTNHEGAPVAVTVSSAFGAKSFPAIAPDRNGFHAFTTRQGSLAPGSMTIAASATVGGEQISKNLTLTYPALSCG